MATDPSADYGRNSPTEPQRAMPAPAWARVRILLNLGDVEAATIEATRAHESTTWCDRPIALGGPPIHSLPEMPIGWAFLVPGFPGRAVLNRSVVDEFCMSVCLFQFVRITSTLDAPVFRFYDIANWRLLDGMDDDEAAARQP